VRGQKRLQSVQNTAAHLVSGIRRWDHLTPILRSLQRLWGGGRSFSTPQTSCANDSFASLLPVYKTSACRLKSFN